ncbi:hypothetical protein MMC26_002565 [Xylographa opegraphella]|nr:hypothetical protein [Xylographa opegraphella]
MDPAGPVGVRLTILTCGLRTLRTLDGQNYTIDCTGLRPPSRELQYSMNGTFREFRQAFFADEEARAELLSHTAILYRELRTIMYARGGADVFLVVHCKMGVHRSVSMAEVLAKRARSWWGVEVRLRHLDLDRNWERYKRSVGRERGGWGEGREGIEEREGGEEREEW